MPDRTRSGTGILRVVSSARDRVSRAERLLADESLERRPSIIPRRGMRNFFEIKKSRAGSVAGAILAYEVHLRVRNMRRVDGFFGKIPREFGLICGNEMKIPRWARRWVAGRRISRRRRLD